uniref:Uncharacterized protein n=1 Tax=Arundo donax TaxID=35708 RepID=A0A0A8ZFG1_ARUDO
MQSWMEEHLIPLWSWPKGRSITQQPQEKNPAHFQHGAVHGEQRC